MSINLNEIAILNIRGVDYRCIINRIDKSEAVNFLQSANLTEERGVLSTYKNYYHIQNG